MKPSSSSSSVWGGVGCVCQMWSGRDHFLLRQGRRVKEGLRWRLAEAPSPLMRPLRIPIQSGRGFRFDVGRRSDFMSATIPK